MLRPVLLLLLVAAAAAAPAPHPVATGGGARYIHAVFVWNVTREMPAKTYWFVEERVYNASYSAVYGEAYLTVKTIYREVGSSEIRLRLELSNNSVEYGPLSRFIRGLFEAPAFLGYQLSCERVNVSLRYDYSVTMRIMGVPVDKFTVDGGVDYYDANGTRVAHIRVWGELYAYLLLGVMVEASLTYTGWSYTNENISIWRRYEARLLRAEVDPVVSHGDASVGPYVFIAVGAPGSSIVLRGLRGEERVAVETNSSFPAIAVVVGTGNKYVLNNSLSYSLNVAYRVARPNTTEYIVLDRPLPRSFTLRTTDYIIYDNLTVIALVAVLVIMVVVPAMKLVAIARRHIKPRFRGSEWMPSRMYTTLSDHEER